MPDMPQCIAWEMICEKVGDWAICTDTPGNIIAEMRMYFHWEINDYILFENWIPYDPLTYAISLIAVFFMALLHEGFKVVKINVEARWQMKASYEPLPGNSSLNSTSYTKSRGTLYFAPFDWRRDVLRSIFRTIDIALHFFIMLVVMAFNAGLFIAVVLGYGLGHLAFSRLSKPQYVTGETLDVESCH
jgi:copper transporter 1